MIKFFTQILEYFNLNNKKVTNPFQSTFAHLRLADQKDKESPNLYLNKIINDGNIKCQIIAHHNKNNIHVKILEINWERMNSYLDVGKIYPVYKHSSKYLGDDMQVWEISPKRMKRSTSQVLLCWEKGIGWTWDLDF